MMVHSGLSTPPVFMPVVANFYKGLAVSVPLHQAQILKSASAAQLHAAYGQRYAAEPFIRLHGLDDESVRSQGFFDVQANNDTNRVDVFVYAHDSRFLLMARLDNLGKGASGAAVQAMNVHLGIEEGLGL